MKLFGDCLDALRMYKARQLALAKRTQAPAPPPKQRAPPPSYPTLPTPHAAAAPTAPPQPFVIDETQSFDAQVNDIVAQAFEAARANPTSPPPGDSPATSDDEGETGRRGGGARLLQRAQNALLQHQITSQTRRVERDLAREEARYDVLCAQSAAVGETLRQDL